MPPDIRRDLRIRAGILLILVGVGSVVLHSFTAYQFQYLMWADGMEPYIGLGIAALGVALLRAPLPRPAHEPAPVEGPPVEPPPVDPPTVPIPPTRRYRPYR